jgi:hypothetical protein
MNANMMRSDPTDGLPIHRWFVYLLFYVFATLLAPYFTNSDTRYHSPWIAMYQKVGSNYVPTTEKIWIDAYTYSKLNNDRYLYYGLAMIVIESLVFIVPRSMRYLRSRTVGSAKAPVS